MKKFSVVVYALLGAVAILYGAVNVLFPTFMVPEAAHSFVLSHIFREQAAAAIFVGCMFLWCIFNYERRTPVHLFLTGFAFLLAAIHWFDYLSGHLGWASPLYNTVPFLGLLIMALLNRRAQPNKQESSLNLEQSPSSDQLSAKQFEKLHLEIAGLHKQQSWESFTRLMPLIAAFITMAGFAVPIIVFVLSQRAELRTRDSERRGRLQDQIRSDNNQILAFTGNKRPATSQVVFLLNDMNTILNTRLSNGETLGEDSPAYRRSLTEGLIALVIKDCDFTKNPGDVEFANAVAENWEDYAPYLRKNSERKSLDSLDYIFFKYIEALRNFRDANPGYLQSFKVENDSYVVDLKYGNQKEEEARYRYFLDLRDGIKIHLKILDEFDFSYRAKQMKSTWVGVFEGLVCNPVISKDALGTDFDSSKPCEY
jgi:hypothetical protein